MPTFYAADYPQKGDDDGMAQAAMAAADKIKVLEQSSPKQFRRRWDPDLTAYHVEPILDPGPDVFMCADFAEEAARTGRDARDLARAAGEARAKELEAVAGYEQRQRWSGTLQAYWIEQVPFKAPDRPWNMTDNQPPARRPDWDRKPTIFTAFDRLIPEAAQLQSLQWLACDDTPRDGRPINAIREALQQGLDAQWGRGHFWAYNHGHRISIQCRYPLDAGSGLASLKGRDWPEATVLLDEKQNLTREEALKHGLIGK